MSQEPSIRNWIVTEYEWPRETKYTDEEMEQWRKDCEAQGFDDQNYNTFHELSKNKNYLKGWGAVWVEHKVDAFDVSPGLSEIGVSKDDIGFVIWGSPHVELPSREKSYESDSSEAVMKNKTFSHLCEHFPNAIILMTYCNQVVAPPSHARSLTWNGPVHIYHSPDETIPYRPRLSTGGSRCHPADTCAVIRAPTQAGNVLALTTFEQDGAVNLFHFISICQNVIGSKKTLFLGEECASLSKQAAEWHLFSHVPGVKFIKADRDSNDVMTGHQKRTAMKAAKQAQMFSEAKQEATKRGTTKRRLVGVDDEDDDVMTGHRRRMLAQKRRTFTSDS